MQWKSNLFPLISAFALISILVLQFPHKSPSQPTRRAARALQTLDTHLQFIHWACEDTRHRDLCISTLINAATTTKPTSVPHLIASIIATTLKEVNQSSSACSAILHRRGLTPRERRAVGDCIDLLNYTAGELSSATADLTSSGAANRHIHDLQTLLSAAMTNQFTCLDGFAYGEKDKKVRKYIERNLYNISHHVSNSLSMLRKITSVKPPAAEEKEALFPEYGTVKDGFPTWVSGKDRRLLQAAVNVTKFDLVVAKDGSGNFTTIGEAVEAAPNSSTTRFVIHIKAGAYFENVEVVKKKTKLMFVGDGIGKTVVKSNRNVVDGWTTFRSATVAVVGDGFIAKGITFENSAGPSKHQAVALRSGSDLSAFYLCSFVAYQDTLYVHSLRQFYRDCDVYGTVDFIFGNAAVVLQGCNLYPRKPDPNQKNIVTAQGREDPNQNTGISVINCKIAAAADLIPVKSAFKTYLGRPWKQYSRTVIMKSYIDDVVDPAGWLEWNGSFALDTLYYGEYMNRGPGSNTSSRVKWTGFRVINSSTEATQFTVGPFIQGTEWLNATTIPFSLGLI